MKSKKKEKAMRTMRKMIETLNHDLLNEDLLQFILNCLNFAYRPNYNIIPVSDSEVRIQRRDLVDSFTIKFQPNIENFTKIIITSETDENHVENKLTIDYSDGEYIRITDDTLTKLRDTENVILSIAETKKTTIYQHNALRYERQYNSLLNLHICDNDAITTLEELIIDDDSSAVKCVMYVQDGLHLSTAKYYETNQYDSLPFNTRVNNPQIKNEEMAESSEEVFNAFVERLKNKKALERK